MKNWETVIYLLVLVSATAFSTENKVKSVQTNPDNTESKKLFNEIILMDSIWNDAYNHCNIERLNTLISGDLEFYHDQGGLSTSKESVMNAYKSNICGKVTRELLKGSIEVYPIPNYGAVEMGKHRFFNNEEEKKSNQHFSKFVHIWKNENGHWVITRVISLH